MSDKAREAFEKWYCQDAKSTANLSCTPSEINGLREGEHYGNLRAALNIKWKFWQAAWNARHESTELPEFPEPETFMYQHEETGLVGYVDPWQIEHGFESNNPRLNVIGGLYTADQLRAYGEQCARRPQVDLTDAELPVAVWARDHHGETPVYTLIDVRAAIAADRAKNGRGG